PPQREGVADLRREVSAMTRHWLRGRVRHAAPVMAAIAAAVMLAACSSGSGSATPQPQAGGPHGTIVGSFTSEPYTADFNPYSPGNLAIDNGMIFEPLMFFNTAKAGD